MQVTNSEPKNQDRQNLKIKYKNQRLEEAKQVYFCQCQKKYLSFPALYLHVKNKHKIKLTSKITEKICQIEEKGGKTYITYFLRNQDELDVLKQDEVHSQEARKSSKNEAMRTFNEDQHDKVPVNFLNSLSYGKRKTQKINDQKDYELRNIVMEFIRERNFSNLHQYQCQVKILMLLIDYVQKCSLISKQFERLKNHEKETMISLLPLYLNDFICYFLPGHFRSEMCGPLSREIQIQIMKLFANWLRQKKYTDFLILEVL